MEKFKGKFNKENRTIDVTYQIKNKKFDEALFHAITDIVRENKLDCSFGEDDKGLRYIHISGKDIENVTIAYNCIEGLK